MPITMYEKKDFKGSSLHLSSDVDDLYPTPVGYKTSSARIEGGGGALFFTKTRWDGRVMCRRSVMGINDLGDYGGLGRVGFDNSVKSIRISPFNVKVRYFVVTNSRGNYPGSYTNWSSVTTFLSKVHSGAAAVWQNAFIQLLSTGQEIVEHDGFYRIDSFSAFALTSDFHTRKDVINVFLVSDIRDAVGQACSIPWSTRLAIEPGSVPAVTRTLAHEIGHVFGLSHGSKKEQTLMRQTKDSSSLALTDDQIEEVHQNLSVRAGVMANLRLE